MNPANMANIANMAKSSGFADGGLAPSLLQMEQKGIDQLNSEIQLLGDEIWNDSAIEIINAVCRYINLPVKDKKCEYPYDPKGVVRKSMVDTLKDLFYADGAEQFIMYLTEYPDSTDVNKTMTGGDVMSDIQSKMKDAASDVQSKMKDAASDVQSKAEDAASDVQSKMKDAASDVQSKMKDAASDVQSELEDAASDVQSELEDAASDVQSELEDAVDIVSESPTALGNTDNLSNSAPIKIQSEKATEILGTFVKNTSSSIECAERSHNRIHKLIREIFGIAAKEIQKQNQDNAFIKSLFKDHAVIGRKRVFEMKGRYIHTTMLHLITILTMINPNDNTSQNVGIKPFVDSVAEIYTLQTLYLQDVKGASILASTNEIISKTDQIIKKIPSNFVDKIHDYANNTLTSNMFKDVQSQENMLVSFRDWFSKFLPKSGGKHKPHHSVSRKPKKRNRTRKHKQK